MSFAVPAALMLAAIALPIIAFYILKVRLRRMKVSTNLFWKQVYEEKPPRSLWQNLRHILSLLAQLLLLLLLVLAAADPYFAWQALQARRIVIVLDTSASMRATDISPSRFEAARASIHRFLNGLRFRDEVAIVSAGHQPEVVLGMASHTPTLRRALDSVQPSDTAAALESAIELAKQLIGDHPNGQVLVYSDGCAQRIAAVETTLLTAIDDEKLAGANENLSQAANSASTSTSSSSETAPTTESNSELVEEPADEFVGELVGESKRDDQQNATVQVIHHTLATAAGNVGITQFQARRSLIDPVGYEVLVALFNASDLPIKGRLDLELEEIPVDVIPFELKPNETWTRSVEKTSLEGGVLRATLSQLAANAPESDSEQINTLPTDDRAWAIIPPRQVQDVLIVSPGNLFLRKVFEANPLVNVTVVNQLPDSWPAQSIVVLHRLIPPILPQGQLLVIDPENDSNAWSIGKMIENPIVTEQDEDSPLMTHIRLDNVLLPEAQEIKFGDVATTLAATVTGETVYALLNRSDGPCLVLSVDLERSDLAFRTTFPIMITNALSWFAGQPGELQPSVAGGQLAKLNTAAISPTETDNRTDETVAPDPSEVNDPPIRQRGLQLLSPAGAETAVLSQQVGPLDEIGIWDIVQAQSDKEESQSQTVQRFAVNLANAAESDLRPEEAALASSGGEGALTSAWFSRPVWFYLIVTATAFCALEWFLYQRRVIS